MHAKRTHSGSGTSIGKPDQWNFASTGPGVWLCNLEFVVLLACTHVCVLQSPHCVFVFYTHVLVVCSLCGLLHRALSIFLKASKCKKT